MDRASGQVVSSWIHLAVVFPKIPQTASHLPSPTAPMEIPGQYPKRPHPSPKIKAPIMVLPKKTN